MLAKRIIPCLDIKDGRTVKGVNFEQLRDAGDAVELAKYYSDNGADELVFLDITATIDKRKTLTHLVDKIAQVINIPFTVGGGINTIDDVASILNSGADKIAINSAAVKNPDLINKLADKFGNQCIVLAVDAKQSNGQWKVFVNGGRTETDKELFNWCSQGVERGVGEILFTSMDHDGTKKGFSIDALNTLCKTVNVPVIASGGAGSINHFIDLFSKTNTDAALAASIFHFNEITIPELKYQLKNNKITIR